MAPAGDPPAPQPASISINDVYGLVFEGRSFSIAERATGQVVAKGTIPAYFDTASDLSSAGDTFFDPALHPWWVSRGLGLAFVGFGSTSGAVVGWDRRSLKMGSPCKFSVVPAFSGIGDSFVLGTAAIPWELSEFGVGIKAVILSDWEQGKVGLVSIGRYARRSESLTQAYLTFSESAVRSAAHTSSTCGVYDQVLWDHRVQNRMVLSRPSRSDMSSTLEIWSYGSGSTGTREIGNGSCG